MRKMKKLAAVILAAIMVLAMGITSFADEGQAAEAKGSITITNAKNGETYDIYKVFDLTYQETEDSEKPNVAYTYNKTADTDNLYTALAADGSPFDLTPTGTMQKEDKGLYNVTLKKTPVPETEPVEYTTATGEEIGNWFKDNQTLLKRTATKTAEGEADADIKLVFDELYYGYYYVTTTQGTLVTVNSTIPEVEVVDKTVEPSITKQVQELSTFGTSTEAWGDKNDASYGDVVNFKIIVNVESGAANYMVTDELPDGLTLISDPLVKSKIGETETDLIAGKDFKFKADDDNKGFTLQLTDSYLDAYYNNQKAAKTPVSGEVTITYSTIVGTNAVIDGEGNVNTAYLTYGDAQQTPEVKTTTYVHDFDVFKYTGEEKTALADADFSVYTDEACSNVLQFTKRAEGEVYFYNAAPGQGETVTTVITTTASGAFTVEGLDSGTYWLKEVDAPAGYMILEEPVKVVIDGTISETVTYEVENTPGQPLPTTGGMGTTLFYVIGALLILAGGAIVLKKRNEA